jgi:hypothetical protein
MSLPSGILRNYSFELWERAGKALENVLEEVQMYYLQSLEMVKPKQKERPRERIRMNDRHITELNYQRGF